ncbi:type 4a pilus biogenesis protein PilO [Thiotrichales bacterium 19S9-12]|nr:type 4a pilus biogenesis protein PilO [Thiotrichales bacterium 19S9-11]MCF6811238.1 type 4a pilus biogenesis protein PilO [Thiotrichales bacterium 19S9-12]
MSKIMSLQIQFEDLVNLPRSIKQIALSIIFILSFLVGYWLFIQEKLTLLDVQSQKQASYQAQLKTKINHLAKRSQYQSQIDTLNIEYNQLMDELPQKENVSSLIDQITDIALTSGLKFHLIRPLDSRSQKNYSELPIEIVVEGTYNQVGRFISGLVSMPRVVTVDSFTLKQAEQRKSLILTLNAMTYHNLDQSKASIRERKNETD